MRQIATRKDLEKYRVADPEWWPFRTYRVPWRGGELIYRAAIERGIRTCPVCGAKSGMGDLVLSGHGVEVRMRFEDIHFLEAHDGKIRGQPVVDLDQLRKVLGVK